MMRPSVKRSAAAIWLAKIAGWCMGTLMMPVRKRIRRERGGNIESQRKRRARKFIFSETFCRREEIISQLIGEGDLLEDLSVSLPF